MHNSTKDLGDGWELARRNPFGVPTLEEHLQDPAFAEIYARYRAIENAGKSQ